jgi:hypothetical protein
MTLGITSGLIPLAIVVIVVEVSAVLALDRGVAAGEPERDAVEQPAANSIAAPNVRAIRLIASLVLSRLTELGARG